jgi:serine/threonine protein kinase
MITYNSNDISEDIDNLYTSESNSNNKIILNEQNNLFGIIIYIQMEACKMTLKEYIFKTNPNLIDINNIIKDILSAVKYIHSKNIIHCDLSLINILVDENNTIKICDFGLAEDIGNNDYTIKSKSYGNLIYCAPESIQYNKYSYKSDIYSLGIIFYELLNKFSTEMERLIMIKKFKNKEIDCKYKKILYSMINIDENARPLIDVISIKYVRKFLSKK